MSKSTKAKIELNAEDTRFVIEQVEAGTYQDISEAAHVAVKMLRLRAQKLAAVREEFDQLCADMDAGKGIELSNEEFAALVRKKASKHVSV